VTAQSKVDLHLKNGDIEVRFYGGTRLYVATAEGRSLEGLRVQKEGREVRLSVPLWQQQGERIILLAPRGLRFRLETFHGVIEVGAGAEAVEARTLSGRIQIGGVRGTVRARAVSGSISIQKAGEVEASTISGSLELVQGQGSIRLRSVSGSIVVRQSQAHSLSLRSLSGRIQVSSSRAASLLAHTFSGNIELRGALGNKSRISLTSSSGDIRLWWPSGKGLSFRLKTTSGALSCSLADCNKKESEFLLKGSLGQGSQSRLVARTVSGDITLFRAVP